MSEDGIRAELQGVRNDVQQLSRDGKEREKKLDTIVKQTTKIEGRVGTLETIVAAHDGKLGSLEKRIYQIGFLILALHGGAREVMALFF